MLTSTFLCCVAILSFLATSFNARPLPLAFALFLCTLTRITLASFSRSSTWFPIVTLMLYLGGILVTFIVLCSLTPNQKIKKIKFPNIAAATIAIIVLYFAEKNLKLPEEPVSTVKTFLEEAPIFISAISIILLYFLRFSKVIGERWGPIRTLWCFQKEIL